MGRGRLRGWMMTCGRSQRPDLLSPGDPAGVGVAWAGQAEMGWDGGWGRLGGGESGEDELDCGRGETFLTGLGVWQEGGGRLRVYLKWGRGGSSEGRGWSLGQDDGWGVCLK